MCGRYYIEIEDKELQEIADEIDKNQAYPDPTALKLSGEIFPTDIVPVQTGPSQYQPMQWGFAGYDGRLLINARSETALEKTTFRESMQHRRCLIPASGYYEWQKIRGHKVKYRFYISEGPLYLAGCYRQEKNSALSRFVILTKPALDGVEVIHNRMPVIIPKEHTESWLQNAPKDYNYAMGKLLYEVV